MKTLTLKILPIKKIVNEKKVKILFLKVFLFLFKQKKTELNPNNINRILIIRQHDQLGDFLIATPTIRAIRKKYPTALISIVVKDYTLPVILNNPNVDRIIIYKEKFKNWNLKWLKEFLSEIMKPKYDLAIVLNTISRSITSDLIAILSRSKNILSSDVHLIEGFTEEPVYSIISKRDKKNKTEIERNLDIVKTIGVKPDGLEYDLFISKEEIFEANKLIKNLKIPSRNKIITVHFGTLDVTRRFPLNKLAKVVDAILENYNVSVLNMIGKNEIELREEFEGYLKNKIFYLPLVPIRISAAIIKRSSLFICNDTGTLHIAAAVNTPTISFHSLNDPKIWKPPFPKHIPVRAKNKLIDSITHKDAMRAINLAMNKFVR